MFCFKTACLKCLDIPPRREIRATASLITDGQAEGEANVREEPLPPPSSIGVPPAGVPPVLV